MKMKEITITKKKKQKQTKTEMKWYTRTSFIFSGNENIESE